MNDDLIIFVELKRYFGVLRIFVVCWGALIKVLLLLLPLKKLSKKVFG